MEALTREAERVSDVRLLIIDPIVNAVMGDGHNNADVRRSLQPVVDLAARLDAAVIGVSHFTKNTSGRDPVERVTGSVAFGALPRLVFGAAKMVDDDGTTRRLFVRAKSNIGPDGGGYGYDLQQEELRGFPGVFASRVLWKEPLDGAARELLAVAETIEDSEERNALNETTEWLGDLITAEGGELDKRDIIKLARENGFSERTVHRARGKLGLQVRTSGFGKEKRSRWILPNHANCAIHANFVSHKNLAQMARMKDSTGAAEGTANHWRVHFPNREPPEIFCSPDASKRQVLDAYPDAVAAEATQDTPKHRLPLSPELETLVRQAAEYYECPPDELELMLEAARNDPEGALTCYQRFATRREEEVLILSTRKQCLRVKNEHS